MFDDAKIHNYVDNAVIDGRNFPSYMVVHVFSPYMDTSSLSHKTNKVLIMEGISSLHLRLMSVLCPSVERPSSSR